ncbi:MAG: MlaD family protein [Thermodesulfovibrionales bacterium]|nr:MlaD family protein [Thermodesulfovibrionales bacterium]
MQEIKETDPRFLFLKGKVWLFSVIALLSGLLLLFLIAKERGLFVKMQDVYFIADRATGLSVGMPVKVSGFKIGRLKEMQLQDDASVKVILSIESSHMKWLRTDSFAILTKEGLIGESIIEVIPGRERQLRPGEPIRFERLKGIEEMAGELKQELTDIIGGIKELLDYINSPRGEIKRSLSNIQKVTENLIETTESMNKLLEELNRRAVSIGESTEDTLAETKRRLEEISGLITTTRESIDRLSKELIDTAKTIKETVDLSSKDIPAILENTRRNLEDIEDILQSIKGLWPVRSGIKKIEIKPLEGDTYER